MSTPIREAAQRAPAATRRAERHIALDRDGLLAAVVLTRGALFAGALAVAVSKIV